MEADFEPYGTGTAMLGGGQTSFGWLQPGKVTFAILLIGGSCVTLRVHTDCPPSGKEEGAHGM